MENKEEFERITLGFGLGGSSCNVGLAKKIYSTKDKETKLKSIHLLRSLNVETTSPEETLNKLIVWSQQTAIQLQLQYHDVGIASFGPICLDEQNEQMFGSITTTPKVPWRNFSIIKYLRKHLVPIQKETPSEKAYHIETDVNACAMAEFYFGLHECRTSLAYITVGTGIGIGMVVNSEVVHGLLHPEGGHQLIRPHEVDQTNGYKSVCASHEFCIEGYANNIALKKRKETHKIDTNTQKDLLQCLSDQDQVWELEAFYLAQACVNITLIASIEGIVLGGGVMNRQILYPKIRSHFSKLMAGYLDHPKLKNLEQFIVQPRFKNEASVDLIAAMLLPDFQANAILKHHKIECFV